MKPFFLAIVSGLILSFGTSANADVLTDNGNLYLFNGQVNEFSSGSVTGIVYVQEGLAHSPTTVNVRDGASMKGLVVYQHNLANVYGGTITGDVVAHQSSIMTISGGTITGNVFANLDSMITITGGTIDGSLLAVGDGTLLLVGTFDFDYGEYHTRSELDDSLLTGTLADGSEFSNLIDIFQDGKVILAPPDALASVVQSPEPASILAWVLMLAAGVLAGKRMRRPPAGV